MNRLFTKKEIKSSKTFEMTNRIPHKGIAFIKSILRYHFSLTKLAKLKFANNTELSKATGKRHSHILLLARTQTGTVPMKDNLAVIYQIESVHSL